MRLGLVLLGALTLSSGAAAMPVSVFLPKAEALQKKGPMALFSGDLKVLTRQIKADAAALRAGNETAAKAGRPKAYCTPPKGGSLSNKDILAAMQSVPPASRATTDTRDVLRSVMARKYPCRS